jgi:hypothetical protein
MPSSCFRRAMPVNSMQATPANVIQALHALWIPEIVATVGLRPIVRASGLDVCTRAPHLGHICAQFQVVPISDCMHWLVDMQTAHGQRLIAVVAIAKRPQWSRCVFIYFENISIRADSQYDSVSSEYKSISSFTWSMIERLDGIIVVGNIPMTEWRNKRLKTAKMNFLVHTIMMSACRQCYVQADIKFYLHFHCGIDCIIWKKIQ